MQPKRHCRQGFTLLELLIVVSIMSIIAGMSLMSYGNTRSENEARAVHVEMTQLRLAVMHYFKDQNSYTNGMETAISPADISFLVDQGDSLDWDPDYRTGWRGPYIKNSLIVNAEIANAINFDFSGVGDPESTPFINISVKLDPYRQPYLFFDLNASSGGEPRIVSMGEDGDYGTLDDVVLPI